jgi:hypothetical protein
MRPLVRIFLPVALLALTLSASSADAGKWVRSHDSVRIEGSGDFETRNYDLEGFDSIRIDGVFVVRVTAGEDFAVELEAEDNLIEYISIEVRRGTLVLDLEDDVEIETDEEFRVTISMPELVEIDGNGVYTLRATGLDNERTEISTEGVGEIELEGKTEELFVSCQGVGDMELRDLVAQNADIRVEGIGEVNVFVEQDLRARVSGMGEVRYAGNPDSVDDEVEGFGSIKRSR